MDKVNKVAKKRDSESVEESEKLVLSGDDTVDLNLAVKGNESGSEATA